MPWLMRDDQVLASAEVASGRSDRRRGLTGRDGIEGVFVLRARSVHTFGMRFPIEVAFCDEDGVVIRIVTMVPNRVSRFHRGAASAVEAPLGAFREWGVSPGDRLEIR
jgi:uncharacterized protein